MSRKNKILELSKKVGQKLINTPISLEKFEGDYLKYNENDLSKGAIIDVEATGLNKFPLKKELMEASDEIIEIAILPFLYNTRTKEIVKGDIALTR